MRRLLHSITLVLSLMLMSGAAMAEVYELSVNGLACPFCAYGIEKQLSQIDGVESVETNVGAGTVTVTMAEGKVLDQTRAEKAVSAAGFTLEGFE